MTDRSMTDFYPCRLFSRPAGRENNLHENGKYHAAAGDKCVCIHPKKKKCTNMTGSKPLVSIGLPVYNGENFIPGAIDSLLAQDYAQIELIISDNASTDRTPEICREYAAKDSRVHYHRNSTNLGVVKNFNRVFELSSGDYFMWAGDHDLRAPTYVSRCMEIMAADPSVVLCCSQTVRVAPDGSHSAIIPPRLDTRGLAVVTRFQLVIWSLSYCYQTYGLIRSDALQAHTALPDTIGPDAVC